MEALQMRQSPTYYWPQVYLRPHLLSDLKVAFLGRNINWEYHT